MSNKLGQDPAFPCEVYVSSNGDGITQKQTDNRAYLDYGITKRFYAACAAMSAVILMEGRKVFSIQEDIILAYKYADELLKQENG